MGKKLRVLNVVLPAVCAVTLVTAPMTVWGVESSRSANNFNATCIGDIKLSNKHAKLHHDFHTVVMPKKDNEEIDTEYFGKPVIVFVGDAELNDDEISYTWDNGWLKLDVLGEYITQQTLIIIAKTTKKATLELTSSPEQSTPKEENYITYEFSFAGKQPLGNIINVSIENQIVDPPSSVMELYLSSPIVGVYDDNVNVDFKFINKTGSEILTPCTITFTLVLQFNSGNTEQEQTYKFTDLKASLT